MVAEPLFDPLLTIERRGGNQGQAWVTETTKIPQGEGIGRRRVTARGRACPRWCSLSVPLSFERAERRPVGPRRFSLTTVVPVALAAETVSIAIMELIDSLTAIVVPIAWQVAKL